VLTAVARTRNPVWPSPPPDDNPAMRYRLPVSPRAEFFPPCQREFGGVFYNRRSGARLIAATLGSLLVHAGLMVFLGEPPRAANPEIPPRIALRLSESSLPSLEPTPPVPPPPAPETSPPTPPAVSPPPLPPVAKAPEPKFEPAPRPRSEPKRAAPKTASPVARPRPEPKPPRPKTAVPVARPPAPQPARSVVSGARPAPMETVSASRSPPVSPPVEEAPLILDPRYRRPPKPPAYPQQAIRLGLQGKALVRARISTAGNVIEVYLHQSSGYSLLDDAALAAVRRWAFIPATHNGIPREAWVQAPVNFVLNENRRGFP
jgi:protein TonB